MAERLLQLLVPPAHLDEHSREGMAKFMRAAPRLGKLRTLDDRTSPAVCRGQRRVRRVRVTRKDAPASRAARVQRVPLPPSRQRKRRAGRPAFEHPERRVRARQSRLSRDPDGARLVVEGIPAQRGQLAEPSAGA